MPSQDDFAWLQDTNARIDALERYLVLDDGQRDGYQRCLAELVHLSTVNMVTIAEQILKDEPDEW